APACDVRPRRPGPSGSVARGAGAPGRPPVVSRPAAEPRRGGGTGAVTDAGGVPEPSRERRKCPLRAVILAGGTGTRLRPLTYWTNKHLLPVGHYPMICYGVARLRQAG